MRLIPFVIAAVVLVSAGRAHAQIVDVQSQIGEEVKDGASGKLEAAGDWRTGNTRRLRVSGAVIARYRHGDHLGVAVARGEYGRSGVLGMDGQVTDASRDFEHLRYRWRALDWLAPEAFVQHEADKFRRLRSRALAGAGVRFRVAKSTDYAVNVGVGVMVEHERLVNDLLPDAGLANTDVRLSTYVVALAKFNDHVGGSETLYVQPRVDAPGDVRLLDELALIAKLADRLAFRFAITVARDSRPPPGTRKLDAGAQTGLVLEF